MIQIPLLEDVLGYNSIDVVLNDNERRDQVFLSLFTDEAVHFFLRSILHDDACHEWSVFMLIAYHSMSDEPVGTAKCIKRGRKIEVLHAKGIFDDLARFGFTTYAHGTCVFRS